jgi:hypothetical protein
MHRGYAKIYRKFLEWEWYSDLNTKALFLHLLLTANHKDKKWKGIDIKKGQVLSGLKTLNADTGLSESKLRTSLKKLKSTGEITVQSTNLYSIITVCNYCEYHDYDSGINSQDDSPDNIPVTIKSQSNDKQVTTTKNDKHYNHDKELSFSTELENKIFNSLQKNYKSHIEQIKPDTVKKLVVNLSSGLYSGVDVPYQIERSRHWMDSNPTKRKTPKGLPRFLTGWIDRQQNSNRGNQQQQENRPENIEWRG